MSAGRGVELHELLGEHLLKPEQVAEFLGISRAAAYRLAGQDIPCVRIGHSVRFRPSDIRAYLERQTVRPTPGTRAARLLSSA